MVRTRPRAVICEDDADLRRAVSLMMVRCGMDVAETVASARDLAAAATSTMPDMIVLDLALAGVGGLQIVRRLRAQCPDCVIVVLCPCTPLRQAAIDAGAVVVNMADLRELEACLPHGQAPHPIGCACCARAHTRPRRRHH